MSAEYHNCSAQGCNMLGSMTRSTSGIKEDGDGWLCFIHFAAPAKRHGEISGELNRLGWLVAIVRDMRGRGDKNANAYGRAMVANDSAHLRRLDYETTFAWLIRLEATLQQACAAPAPETAPLFEEKK